MDKFAILIILALLAGTACGIVSVVTQPPGAIHLGIVHLAIYPNETRLTICKPADQECQNNPFDYPIPGDTP